MSITAGEDTKYKKLENYRIIDSSSTREVNVLSMVGWWYA